MESSYIATGDNGEVKCEVYLDIQAFETAYQRYAGSGETKNGKSANMRAVVVLASPIADLSDFARFFGPLSDKFPRLEITFGDVLTSRGQSRLERTLKKKLLQTKRGKKRVKFISILNYSNIPMAVRACHTVAAKVAGVSRIARNTEDLSPIEVNLREYMNAFKQVVEEGHVDRFGGGKYVDKAFGDKQRQIWVRAGTMALKLVRAMDHLSKDLFGWIIPELTRLAGVYSQKLDLAECVAWPIFIQGTSGNKYAMPVERQACWMRHGADLVLQNGTTDPDAITGFIRREEFDLLSMNQTDGEYYMEITPINEIEEAKGQVLPSKERVKAKCKRAEVRKGPDVLKTNAYCAMSKDASWYDRYNEEGVRRMPFGVGELLLSQLWQTLRSIDAIPKDAPNRDTLLKNIFISDSVDLLVYGVAYASWEWTVMHAGKDRASSNSVTLENMLNGYVSGSPINIPASWCVLWKGREVTYVKESEIGYEYKGDGMDLWERYEFDRVEKAKKIARREEDLGRSAKFKEQNMSQAPFIERNKSRLAPQLTKSSLTSCGQKLIMAIYAAAINAQNSAHLDTFEDRIMHDYWRDTMMKIMEYPGKYGKKLQKSVFPLMRYVLAYPRVCEVPNSGPPIDGVWMGTSLQRCEDEVTMISLWDDHGDGTSYTDEKLRNAVCSVAEDMGYTMARRILTKYCGIVTSKDGIVGMPWTYIATDVADIVSHLTRPDVVEGYDYTSNGAKSVYGFDGHVSHLINEGINNKVKQADYQQLLHLYNEVVQIMVSESFTVDDFKRDLRDIIKGTSGGADKMRVNYPREVVLGEKRQAKTSATKKNQNYDVISGNTSKKSVTIAAGASLFFQDPQVQMAYALDPEIPKPTANRIQVARKARIVWNARVMTNLVQTWFVHAIEKFEKSNPRYSPKNQTGHGMEDMWDYLRYSVQIVSGDSICHAFDASSMDQHEGVADKNVVLDAIKSLTKDFGGAQGTFSDIFGETYPNLLKKWVNMTKRNFFGIKVKGAATQDFECSCMRSGDIYTTGGNTIKTAAVVDSFKGVLETKGLSDHIRFVLERYWGDDAIAVTEGVNAENYIAFNELFEEHGLACGMPYSKKKAISGRVLHYLQLLYVRGIFVARGMAIDHENWVTVYPNTIGSLVSKIVKMGTRGGNLNFVNRMVISYTTLANEMDTFGESTRGDANQIFAANGTLGTAPFGFPGPTARLWLQLNAHALGNIGEMQKIMKRTDAAKIGKRVTNYLIEKDVPMSFNVSGVPIDVGEPNAQQKKARIEKGEVYQQGPASIKTLFEQSFRVLSEPTRIMKPGEVGFAAATAAADAEGVGYKDYNRRIFESGVGNSMRDGFLAKFFLAKDLEAAGMIQGGDPTKRSKDFKPKMQQTIPMSDKTNFKVGNYDIDVKYLDGAGIYITSRQAGAEAFDGTINTLWFSVRYNDEEVKRIPFAWNPYCCFRYVQQLSGSLFGIVRKAGSIGGKKDALKSLATGHFRMDGLKPETVFELVTRWERVDGLSREEGLRIIGFKDLEMEDAMATINNMADIEEVDDFDDQTSMSDHAKCFSTKRIMELIGIKLSATDRSQACWNSPLELNSSAFVRGMRRSILRQFAGLITFDINFFGAFTPDILSRVATGEDIQVSRLPSFSCKQQATHK